MNEIKKTQNTELMQNKQGKRPNKGDEVLKKSTLKDINQNIFNNRIISKLSDTQTNLQNNQIIILNEQQKQQQTLKQQSKKLKKKINKKNAKAPQKIKVKNKLFADINIEQKNEHLQSTQNDNNLIQQEISNESNKDNSNNGKEITFQKHKQIFINNTQSKLNVIVQKTQILKAKYQFKRVDENSMAKAYIKKKMEEVQDAQEIIIDSVDMPNIYKNKIINATFYLNNEKIKAQSNIFIEQSQKIKKITAQERYRQNKMLKNRDYFYKRLNEKIRAQKQYKIQDNAAEIKEFQKSDKILLENNPFNQNLNSLQLRQQNITSKQPISINSDDQAEKEEKEEQQ